LAWLYSTNEGNLRLQLADFAEQQGVE